MKSPLLLSSALALGLVSGAIALPALASADDDMPMPGHEHHHMWGGHGGMFRDGHGPGRAFEHVDGGLAYIKAELKITPQQETAWAPFEAAVRAQAAIAKAHFEERKAAKNDKDKEEITLPERLDMMQKHLQAGLSTVQALSEKTNALYAALSADQKKTADALLPSPMLPFPL